MTEQLLRAYVYVMSGLIGLCIGSFLNVVVYRLPRGESLVTPASHCPACNHMLRAMDNIPVLSYVLLGGKCRYCRAPISVRYPLVELATSALYLASAYLFFDGSAACIFRLIGTDIALSALLAIALIDLRHKIIPDSLSAVIFICGCVLTAVDGEYLMHIIGFVIGGGVFLLTYFVARLVLGREGMGFGDVKLMAASGLLLGVGGTLLSILISSVTASVVLVAVRYFRRDGRDTEYPLAPFLSFGTAVSLFFGESMISAYLSILR